MSRYIYDIIIKDIGTKAGIGPMEAHSVTVHHTAVATDTDKYNIIERCKAYTRYHNGVMPYHFYIPRSSNDRIYCTQFVNRYTWHNANYTANKDCIAVCMEGNYQNQRPTAIQLEKLAQLLDDISKDWFSSHGWKAFDVNINPQDNTTIRDYQGKKVKQLHYHNEVAQPGHATACSGTNLKPYVVEYREKQGNVDWKQGDETPPAEPPIEPPIEDCEKGIAKRDELINSLEVKVTKLENDNEQLRDAIGDQEQELTDKDIKIDNQGVQITKLLEANKELVKIAEGNCKLFKVLNFFFKYGK